MDRNRIIMIGSGCVDEYYELGYVPLIGEKTVCRPLRSEVGGMIGNAAAVAAAYGMETYLMDTVNQSIHTQRVLGSCREQNIKLNLIRYDDALPDVKCMIFIKDGERMIYVIPTQKQNIRLDPDQEKIIKGAGYIYSTTAELQCFENPMKAVDVMKSQGAKLVLDVEYVDPMKAQSEWELIRRADLLFINDQGDRQMTDIISGDYVKVLLQGGAMVIKTKGSEGSQIYESSGTVTELLAYRISAVDTTGAGDTFNTSFVYGLSRDWEVKAAGRFASAAAARAILTMGPRSGAVKEEQVREFIRDYKVQSACYEEEAL